MPEDPYRPLVSDEEAETIRHWHERASAELHALGAHDVTYLGLDLHVPEHVFPPQPMSELLGTAVLAEARDADRVLDMGTGSGNNAILAARRAHDVIGVDINPHAVEAARANAARNGVAARTTFSQSDLFEAVDGQFDLIVFDPPFRWFRPRDLLEVAFADEDYRTLTRFVREAPGRLAPGGRILMFFGTSGDLAYFEGLIREAGLRREVIESRQLTRNATTITYYAFRLTARPR